MYHEIHIAPRAANLKQNNSDYKSLNLFRGRYLPSFSRKALRSCSPGKNQTFPIPRLRAAQENPKSQIRNPCLRQAGETNSNFLNSNVLNIQVLDFGYCLRFGASCFEFTCATHKFRGMDAKPIRHKNLFPLSLGYERRKGRNINRLSISCGFRHRLRPASPVVDCQCHGNLGFSGSQFRIEIVVTHSNILSS